jgi:hypothetical protein
MSSAIGSTPGASTVTEAASTQSTPQTTMVSSEMSICRSSGGSTRSPVVLSVLAIAPQTRSMVRAPMFACRLTSATIRH